MKPDRLLRTSSPAVLDAFGPDRVVRAVPGRERLSQEWLRHQALARHLVFELQKRDVSQLDGLAQRMV
jgi:hypothetical protein